MDHDEQNEYKREEKEDFPKYYRPGGKFKLITNDGKCDDMIMMDRFLNNELTRMEALKRDPQKRDL